MLRFFIFLLFLTPSVAFPFLNEPDGFRSIPWDSPVNKITGLRSAGPAEGTVRRYIKMDETFIYEGLALTDIFYVTDLGKLVSVELFYNCGQRAGFIELLQKNHGTPTRTARGGTLTWQGKSSTITLAPPAAVRPDNPAPDGEPALCALTFGATPLTKKSR